MRALEAEYEKARQKYGSDWNYYDKKELWISLTIGNRKREAEYVCPICSVKGGHENSCLFSV